MVRSRLLRWIGLLAAWLAGVVMGGSSAALRTDAGRAAVADVAVRYANAHLRGSLGVGAAGGSFFRGLELRGVVVRAPAGDTVVTAELVGLRYRLRDLLRGRIVFGQLSLLRPTFTLVQLRSGQPYNFQQVLPKGDGQGPPGPLIAFNDVRITDGIVVVKTPVNPTDTLVMEREPGPFGEMRVRRISGLAGTIGYLRVASTRRGDPIRAQVSELRSDVTDPALGLRDLRGVVEVYGDSVTLDLPQLVLPDSRGRVQGTLAWPEGPILVDLRVRATAVRTEDVRGLVPALPAGLSGSGSFTVRSLDTSTVEFAGENLAVEGATGGDLRGRLGMRVGPGEDWGFLQTDLRLQDFDLEYVRGFLDTLPFAGRVSGSVSAEGPRSRLFLGLDAQFRDSLVAGQPVSAVRGEGYVSLANEDFVFDRFRLDSAEISLATVRRIVPAMALVGRLWLVGTLDGSWLDATFDGELRFADPPLPASLVRGRLRLDSRGDTLGVWAALAADSLRLQSFGTSFPGFDLRAAWSGRVRVAGYADSLGLDADLTGDAGTVRATGALRFVEEERGAHHLALRVGALDLHRLHPAAPETRLTGLVSATGRQRTGGDAHVRASVDLGASSVAGVSTDSVVVRLAVADSVLRVDTLAVLAYPLEIGASGGVALSAGRRDTLTFVARTDSLGVLEPVLARLFGPLAAGEQARRPSGMLRLAGRLIGSTSSYQVIADVGASKLRRGTAYVARAGASGTWVSATSTLHLSGTIDSIAVAPLHLGGLVAELHGRPDSLRWHARSRLGYGAWIGGGRWLADSAQSRAVFDSLGFSLATGPWFIDTTAILALDERGVTVSAVTLSNRLGPGRVEIEGRWPFDGSGDLHGSVDGLQVTDLLVLLQREPFGADGELSGTFEMRGTARDPVLGASLSLRNGAFGPFRAPYTQGVLAYRDRELNADFELWRLGQQILKVTAALPLDLSLVSVARRRLPGDVSVRARADGVDLSLLEATTPLVRQIAGTLDADFGIEGTWEQPQLAGRIEVRDGAATWPALGVRHERLNGALVLSGDTIHVPGLSVRSGSGTAEVRGFVQLEELSRPILQLQIGARAFRAIDVRGFLTLIGSGEFDLRGPVYHATLRGRGTADAGVLYFADLITKQVVNLEDTLFAQFVDTTLIRRQRLGREFQSRFLDSLRIDSLLVDVGPDFWLRSTEANIQLGGSVFVNKVRDEYRLDGTLQAPRGTYRLQLALGTTREFKVSRGVIRYLGTPDLNADLDIDALHVVRSTRGQDIQVYVNIGGSLYDPRLRLTSDFVPPLSETEIIGYLLFGAPTLQASATSGGLESRVLTQQVFGTLSGQIEYSLISDLGVPLDYLQIRPMTSIGGITGAEVAVGKQFRVFGRTAFLTASPGICRKEVVSFLSVGATLEFRLSPNWLVSASVDPRKSCEVMMQAATSYNYQFGGDLFWEKSF